MSEHFNHTLDPTVASKLRQFSRRRRNLLITRGLCAGIVTFVSSFGIVAAIDWYWLLTDQTRWLLSGGAYAAVAVVVWMTSMRRLLHRPALEEIASHVETGAPELRENLLSAVELATDDPKAIHDSPVFRGLLQGQVAQLMGTVQVPNLLPLKLVAKWAVAAVVLGGVIAYLLTLPDSRFRQLATRAVLPGANIARVSRIHVAILEPTPHSLLLAEDETVAIVAGISGGDVSEVTLETSSPGQGSVKNAMRLRADDVAEYAANIHIQDESVEYRILAGDAVTQWYRIEARPRPHVLAFHKTFEYPEYTKLEPETITESDGNVSVLEGTKAMLTLDIDQPVSEAELRIDWEERRSLMEDSESPEPKLPTTIPLSPGETEKTWTADLPVEYAGLYKVHLVSKETGFENVFSPKYAIVPLPDLIPRTGFVNQQETTLLLPPNDILGLKGMAEDDLPLETLEQQISVNGREWQTVPLEIEPTEESDRQVTAAWQWDLLDLKLKSGDQVITKLVATDRKGNIGESIPLRIVVAAPEFDPQRHQIMEQKVSLYDSFKELAERLAEQEITATEVVERLKSSERSDEEKTVDRSTLISLATQQREQALELLAEIQTVAQVMPAGADAYELELAGQVVARLAHDLAHVAALELRRLDLNLTDKEREDALKDLERAYKRNAGVAHELMDHYQLFATHNLLAALAFDLDAILRQQQIVVDHPTQTWQRLTRQETVVVNQLQVLEQVIHKHRPRVSGSLDRELVRLLNWSDEQRIKLKDAMESEDQLDQLKRVSQDVLRQLESKQQVDNLERDLHIRIVRARTHQQGEASTLYVPIDQTGQLLRQYNRLAAEAGASKDTAESEELLDKARRYSTEIESRWKPSHNQFRDRKELTQARKDADSQYAADLGLTMRAVTSQLYLQNDYPPSESPVPDHLLEIAPAYRILEAGHDVIVARNALTNLLSLERWGSQTIQSHLDHPRQWDLVQQMLERASEQLRNAKVSDQLVNRLNETRWSDAVREASRKIGERRWKRGSMIGANHELVEMRDQLEAFVTELKPVMAEARAIIAKYAPTIPQMAQQAADQLRELEKETTDTADQIEQEQTAETEQQLAQVEEQQNSINEQIEDLMEALVEDANQQDLLDEQQRERARDADDAIAMIQEPAKQMNRELQEAQEQDDAEQQAQELAQTAEQQEKTAQALEMVAEHFARLDEGLDVAETREQLRQMEREQGLARQMDQQFDAAEQLANMAKQDAQSLLEELEAELQQNPAMQQALSEISQNTLQEARNALEDAAQNEQNIQQQNERSDPKFQAKKKEVAEDLKEMARQASELSRYLVAQAEDLANRGKSEEAKQKLDEAEQKLNEAANKANQANENQLLRELAQTAEETKNALREATETLRSAKQDTSKAKNEQIYDNDKSREAAKRDAEKRQRDVHEQQKRLARDAVKRADDTKRREDQNVKNAENNLKRAQQDVQKAQDNVNKNPDNEGLKQALKQQQERQQGEQTKVDLAKQAQQKAQQQAQQARQQQDQTNRKPNPPLNDANPNAQLADRFTEEAIKEAEALNRKAEQLAKATDFGNELMPTPQQLANSQRNQQTINEDVNNTSEDLERAARHEQRLNNATAAQALAQAAENVDQIAQNEAQRADQQLGQAAEQAEQSKQNGQQQNSEALNAQQAVAQSEQVLQQQADQLTETLEAQQAAAQQAQMAQNDPSSPQTSSNQPPAGNDAGEPQQGQPSQQTQGQQPPGQQPAGQQPAFTTEELARGQQLAQTLDELDRQMAAQAAQPQDGQPTQPTPRLESLAQAAQAQQAQMSAMRTQAQQQSPLTESVDPLGDPAATGQMTDFEVLTVNREENENWGKLRDKSAEDLSQGRSEEVAAEYRKSVEAYFRVLAERARQKK